MWKHASFLPLMKRKDCCACMGMRVHARKSLAPLLGLLAPPPPELQHECDTDRTNLAVHTDVGNTMVRVDTVVTEGADIGPAQTRKDACSSRRSAVGKSSAAHPSADTIQQRSHPIRWRLCAGQRPRRALPCGRCRTTHAAAGVQVGSGCSSALTDERPGNAGASAVASRASVFPAAARGLRFSSFPAGSPSSPAQ